MKVDINIDLKAKIDVDVLRLVGSVADEMDRECYIVGGWVRDLFLHRESTDMDFVTVGSGIELAKCVARRTPDKSHLSVFKTYGTAQVKTGGIELEFVGARRESYMRGSRNPIVEDGTLEDDQLRRDFTINAMAISLNAATWGTLVDPFNGLDDLQKGVIRTPRDPDITFSDDPLRMMRAVRFATQLGFDIFPDTFDAIRRNASRLKIITRERIADEMHKIMCSDHPSRGFVMLDEAGLLPLICPELSKLKGVLNVDGRAHKDNFLHTMQVLDNVASASDNEWLRWAALFHDIGKPATRHYDEHQGWTFHNHNFVGEKMVPRIFARMRLPLDDRMRYVKKLVGLHMRPIALVEDEVTDSAVRRMLFEAGDDIDDLMTLCKADITSKNARKVQQFRDNFDLVKQKLIDIEEKDRVRNFQPPVGGEEIMLTFGLQPSKPVGEIKDAIKDAILDGVIANNYAEAWRFMQRKAADLGLHPIDEGQLSYTAVDTSLGRLVLACSARGMVLMQQEEKALDELSKLGKKTCQPVVRRESPLLHNAVLQLREYLCWLDADLLDDDTEYRHEFSLPLDPQGTLFQQRVWQCLLKIPIGETVTYGSIADELGKPGGQRAVAQACARQPLPLIVPCHRVTAAGGKLGGYSFIGTDLKQRLLDKERQQSTCQRNEE